MADWELRPASAADVEVLAELRAVVLRPDLERLGRYDERHGFVPETEGPVDVFMVRRPTSAR
ncbi:hypothetical protein ACIBF5_11945 [Micromonospora sp. NPDC050417]|uniref:hypothetical protein n=1 Tax=Micromonospora sp. NPDC050417 TaxID=3364280 RepID=UPI0037B6CA90